MKEGDRVLTPIGPGTVVYVRFGGPRYVEVEAISVLLDSRRGQAGYSGTLFRPEEVRRSP